MLFTLATFNRDKVREFNRLFEGSEIEFMGISEFPGALVPSETGSSLIENARLKAEAAMRVAAMPAIADDTGLEVDALGGRPGVRSARYAGPEAQDNDNVRAVLEQLKGVPHEKRGARFRTVLVACFPRGREIIAEGVLEGRIAIKPIGDQGFGYDSIFELPGQARTLAELSLDEKNLISHRSRAVEALIKQLWARERPNTTL